VNAVSFSPEIMIKTINLNISKEIYLHTKKRKEFVRQSKLKPCADCGIQYPFYVMDFDHREGEIKELALNQVDRMTMKAIKAEIENAM